MRKQHNKKTEVDLLLPIISTQIIPEEQTDCFGREFEARSSECSICADSEICLVVWGEQVKVKESQIKKERGPFLNQTDFQGVNMKRIEKLARQYESDNEPLSLEELQDLIRTMARTKDDEAIIQFIKRELPLTKMYLKEGKCLVR